MGQKTLGDLIDALEKSKATNVEFSFGATSPTGFISWRGDYSQLSLNWRHDAPPLTRELLLTMAKSAAQGQPFEGYKGGTYRMNRSTPLWADRWGRCDHSAVVGFVEYGDTFIIDTAHEAAW